MPLITYHLQAENGDILVAEDGVTRIIVQEELALAPGAASAVGATANPTVIGGGLTIIPSAVSAVAATVLGLVIRGLFIDVTVADAAKFLVSVVDKAKTIVGVNDASRT